MSAPGADAGAAGAPAGSEPGQIVEGARGARGPVDLSSIHERMNELSAGQQQLVEALSNGYDPYADYGEIEGYEDGGFYEGEDDDFDTGFEDQIADLAEHLSNEYEIPLEKAAAIAAEAFDQHQQGAAPDPLQMVGQAVDQIEGRIGAAEALEERDSDFDDLREELIEHIAPDSQAWEVIVMGVRDWIEQATDDPQPIIDSPRFVELLRNEALAYVTRGVGLLGDYSEIDQQNGQVRGPHGQTYSPNEVQLEPAAGAAQPSTPRKSDEDVLGDRIMAAAAKLRPKI